MLDLFDSVFFVGNYCFSVGFGVGVLQVNGSIIVSGIVVLLVLWFDVGGSFQVCCVGLVVVSSVMVDVEGDGFVLFNLCNDDGFDVVLNFSGCIQVEGGNVELCVQVCVGVVGQVFNMDGFVQVCGLCQQGGCIVIDGGM